MCQDRNLHQIFGSRIVRIQADGGGEFTNQKLRDLRWEKNITLDERESSRKRMDIPTIWTTCGRMEVSRQSSSEVIR